MTDPLDIAKIAVEMRARAEAQSRIWRWRPIESAPRDASWLEVRLPDQRVLLAHYACDMSGEYQPPFKGWFDANLCEIIDEPVEWRQPLELGSFNVLAILDAFDAKTARIADLERELAGAHAAGWRDCQRRMAEIVEGYAGSAYGCEMIARAIRTEEVHRERASDE